MYHYEVRRRTGTRGLVTIPSWNFKFQIPAIVQKESWNGMNAINSISWTMNTTGECKEIRQWVGEIPLYYDPLDFAKSYFKQIEMHQIWRKSDDKKNWHVSLRCATTLLSLPGLTGLTEFWDGTFSMSGLFHYEVFCALRQWLFRGHWCQVRKWVPAPTAFTYTPVIDVIGIMFRFLRIVQHATCPVSCRAKIELRYRIVSFRTSDH